MVIIIGWNWGNVLISQHVAWWIAELARFPATILLCICVLDALDLKKYRENYMTCLKLASESLDVSIEMSQFLIKERAKPKAEGVHTFTNSKKFAYKPKVGDIITVKINDKGLVEDFDIQAGCVVKTKKK